MSPPAPEAKKPPAVSRRAVVATALLLGGLAVALAVFLQRVVSGGEPPRAHPSPGDVREPPADTATLDLAAPRPGRADGAVDVVLVTLDTVRADFLEPYGSPVPTSPFLSALARQGVVFDNAYSTAGWTSPAMASLVTGLYPSEHGIDHNRITETGAMRQPVLPPAADTLAETLHGAGYETFGVCTNMLLSKELGFAQGYDHYVGGESTDRPFPRLAVEALTERMHGSDKYFLWLHYFDPHWPYFEQAPWFRRWNDSSFDTGSDFAADAAKWAYRMQHGLAPDASMPPGAVTQLQTYIQWLLIDPTILFDGLRRLASAEQGRHLVEDHLRYLRASYRSELRGVDNDVERVLEGLGIDDQTLVIVTADHGEELLDHGDLGHSMESLYQELIHIPLIVRLPGGRHGGTVVSSPVSLVDVMPSLLELVGQEAPDGLSGRSFVDLIEGKRLEEGRPIFAELSHASGKRHRTVIWHPWKYIEQVGEDRGELYNLELDPHERHDRAADEPEQVRNLRAALGRWEKRHPAHWAGQPTVAVAPHDLMKLRSLGYVGGE